MIVSYFAVVNPERLGLDMLAFVRDRFPISSYKPFHGLVATPPQIIEAHHERSSCLTST